MLAAYRCCHNHEGRLQAQLTGGWASESGRECGPSVHELATRNASSAVSDGVREWGMCVYRPNLHTFKGQRHPGRSPPGRDVSREGFWLRKWNSNFNPEVNTDEP